MATAPSASYSLSVRVRLPEGQYTFSPLVHTIEEAGGVISTVIDVGDNVRELVVLARVSHRNMPSAALQTHTAVDISRIVDRTFAMHNGGKIAVEGKAPLRTRDDLSMAYTPGVARVCMAIHDDPRRAYHLTIKRNTVAVVTDGTAVLGLGDIGPEAAMPVMEGKACSSRSSAVSMPFPSAWRQKTAKRSSRR